MPSKPLRFHWLWRYRPKYSPDRSPRRGYGTGRGEREIAYSEWLEEQEEERHEEYQRTMSQRVRNASCRRSILEGVDVDASW